VLNRFVFVFVLAFAAACGGSPATPTPQPTPVPVPACQTNQTATVSFKNTASTATHTVIFDGSTVATLAPGQESGRLTVAANVAHTLEFRVTNTTRLACATTQPIFAVCANDGRSCSGN
jgi:hypothetical protein